MTIKISGGTKKAPAKKSVKKDSADDISIETVEESTGKDLTEDLVGDLGINTSELAQALQSEFGMSEWDLIPVIKSTGIRIIDALLSSEEDFVGLTQRTINTLYGDSGIGKTTFWLQAAANMVRGTEAGQIVIWDAEKTTTRQRLATLGLPLNRVTLIKKDTSIEKFFSMCKTIAIMRHEQMEEHGEGYLMENPYIFVVDSIAAMSTSREEEADTDINKAMGVPARMWSALLKTYNDVFFKYNMTVLFVNQVRDKIAMTAADMKKDLVYAKHTESLGGGRAIPYYSFTMTRLGYKGQIKQDQYGFQAIEVDFNLVKTKNSETNRSISAVFIPKSGYSDFWTSLFYLKDNGFVKTGAFYRFDSKGGIDEMFPKTWRLRESEEKYNTDPEFKKAFDRAVDLACEEIIAAGSVPMEIKPEDSVLGDLSSPD